MYGIKRLDSVTETQSVLCKEGIGYLYSNVIQINFRLQVSRFNYFRCSLMSHYISASVKFHCY